MDNLNLRRFLVMQEKVRLYPKPASVQLIERYGANPYLILMATLLSLRARDVVSMPIAEALYRLAPTSADLLQLSDAKLHKILRPIGFYRVKTQTLRNVFAAIEQQHAGNVPVTEADLLGLPGVGRKTANLVRAEVFKIPCICVDTHVHRIANHCGFVVSKTPFETEQQLMRVFPQEYWIEINRVLVTWGQYICKVSLRTCICYTEIGI